MSLFLRTSTKDYEPLYSKEKTMGLKNNRIYLGGNLKIELNTSETKYHWEKRNRQHKRNKNVHQVEAPKIDIFSEVDSQYKIDPFSPNTITHEYKRNAFELTNKNTHVNNIMDLNDMLASANFTLSLDSELTIGMIVAVILSPFLFWISESFLLCSLFGLLFSLFCFIFKIILKKRKITLEYTIDTDKRTQLYKHYNTIKKIASSKKIWFIDNQQNVINEKYHGGASTKINRTDCISTNKIPFLFLSNEKAICFKSKKETLIFLPDNLFMIRNKKIEAINYSDLTLSITQSRFIEDKTIPLDANIVDSTWTYINKDGSPDKRFKDNYKLPICLYGELAIYSNTKKINIRLLFSNGKLQ